MTPTPMETTQDTGSDAGRFDEPGIPSNAPRMLVRVFFPAKAPVRPSIRSGSVLRRDLDKTKGQGFCIWHPSVYPSVLAAF